MNGQELAKRWHEIAMSPDPKSIGDMLHDDAVFESPVVHTPQRGKAIAAAYLISAAQLLGNESFKYTGEWYGDNSCIMEFTARLDGVTINGVDMITCNEDGLINHFKVMVRPLQGINKVHQKMQEILQKIGG